MSDEDPPEETPSSEPPKEHLRESVRSRLESIIPEILKRAVEIGVEKARESPDNLKQFVHDLKVPKEVAHLLFQQIDDTKNGLYGVVAKEIRDFLEHTNFSGEVQKLLTTVQFEVNTTIRFTPNDRKQDDSAGGSEGEKNETNAAEAEGEGAKSRPLPKPEVKTSVRVHRSDPADRRRRTRRSP